jgi:hypothetical protein
VLLLLLLLLKGCVIAGDVSRSIVCMIWRLQKNNPPTLQTMQISQKPAELDDSAASGGPNQTA